MDERIRIILEVQDKASKLIKSVEDRLLRLQGQQAQESKSRWRLSNRAKAELQKQAEISERLHKAQSKVSASSQRVADSLKPLSLRSHQVSAGLRKASSSYASLNKQVEHGATVSKTAGMDAVGQAIEKLGEYAGISTQRVAGMVVNLQTFAGTLKALNQTGDGKGAAGSVGDAGEMGVIQRVLMSIAAAFGLVSGRSKTATKDAGKFGSVGSASVGRFFTAMKAVTAVRVGLFFKRMVSGSKQASNAQQTLAKSVQGVMQAVGITAKTSAVATARMGKGFSHLGYAFELAKQGLADFSPAFKTLSTTFRSIGVLAVEITRPIGQLFNLMKGFRADPFGTMLNAVKALPQGFQNLQRIAASAFQVLGNLARIPRAIGSVLTGLKSHFEAVKQSVAGLWNVGRGAFTGISGLVRGVTVGAKALFTALRDGFKRGIAIQKATQDFKASEQAAKAAAKATAGFAQSFNSLVSRMAKGAGIGSLFGGLGSLGFKGALIDLDNFGKKQTSLFSRIKSSIPILNRQKTTYDKVTASVHGVTKATTGYGNTLRDKYNRMAGGVQLITKTASMLGVVTRTVQAATKAVKSAITAWGSHTRRIAAGAGGLAVYGAAMQGVVDVNEIGIAIGAFNLLNGGINKGIQIIKRRRAAALAAAQAEKSYYTKATEAVSQFYNSAVKSLRGVAASFGLIKPEQQVSRWQKAMNAFSNGARAAGAKVSQAFKGMVGAYDALAAKMFRKGGITLTSGLDLGSSKKALIDLDNVFGRFKKTTSGIGGWFKKFNADVNAQAAATDKAAKAASRFGGAAFAMKVKIALAAVAVGALAIAFGKLVHMAFTRGREHFKAIESATLQYKFLYGSASQAEERIQELTDYAARTPFQLKGIVQANRLLLVFGGKALATQDMLSLIGDAAAVSGQQFERVAFWIGRMYTLLKGGGPIGEATRALTEMGVIGGDLQNELNKMATSGAGLEATFGKLTEHMKKSQGATAEMAETLAGLETTLSDTMDLSLAKWFEALEGDKLEKWFKKNLIGIWNTIGGLAEFVKAVKGAAGSAVDFTVYMVDSERAIRGFVAGLDDQTEAVERATDGYKEMVESTDELKDFWKVAAPAGVATSAKKAMEEFEAADKRRQEAADRREKKEEEARKAAEDAAKAREEEAERAAEAHQRMFESMTLFANETRQFGGELSAIFLPFGELPEKLATAQASASEFFLAWETGIKSSPTIGDLTLTGGPDANAGLKDIPDTWKKASEEASKGIDLVRNAFNLLAKTGDSMASKLFAAGEIVVGAVQGIMNAASKGDVAGALIAAGSALINVFAGMGKTSQELIDTLDNVNAALEEVRSGSLTAAEAIDKATNWQGNEEGFAFLQAAVADFEAIGRTATEAEAMVGAYWEAMRQGDQGAMERIGAELINVAEQARLAREAQERLNATYDAVVDVYLRAKEAGQESYKGIMAAAEEYRKAVVAGDEEKQRELIENHGEWVTSHAAAQDHALAKQEAAAAAIMAKEREKHTFMAALEAALAEIRAGNAAGAAEAARKAAEETSQAWDTAMAAVEQADQAATDAIKGNATDQANHIVSETDRTKEHVLSAEDEKKRKIEEAIAEIEREYAEMGGIVRDESGSIRTTILSDSEAVESKWRQTTSSMASQMRSTASSVRSHWRSTMQDIINDASEMAYEIQGGSIWPDMIAGMVQETDLLLPAVDETMETVRGFIENAETAAREEALLTRIERIKAIEDVAEREKEWRELQLDLAKDWLSKEEEIAKEEERIRDQQLAKEEERLKEQQRLHEEQLAKEEQAARDRAFMADDVRSAARAFGIDSSQLGVEFHAQQAREKAQKWAEQIALLQKGGLSDKQLAQNDVVRSRMARMLEDIDKYGLTLPEHLKGLAQEVGFSRGSGGIRDFGDGTPTMLHNREAVVTERSWLRAIESAARGGGGGNEFHVVDIKWNGLTLGRMNLRYAPKAAHLEGVR